MTIVLHPPVGVTFRGDGLPAEDQARITEVLQAAVRRAISQAVQPGPAPLVPDSPGYAAVGSGPRTAEPAEPFDPGRAERARGRYRVPSYGERGQPASVPVLPGPGLGYDVKSEPSPLEGEAVMALPSNLLVRVESPRYVTAGTLTEAWALTAAVFGTEGFVLLQRPAAAADAQYLAVAVTAVTSADLGALGADEGVPAELRGMVQHYRRGYLRPVLSGADGEYTVRALFTRDRAPLWPTNGAAASWFAQLADERRQGVTAPPADVFAFLVFGEIDELVGRIESGDLAGLQRAAELLSRLDATAFRLVSWEAKVSYLKVLIDAWTWQNQEKAIVQIFLSLDSDSEVDAVIALLRQAGRYDAMFDDLDDELYDLLTTVGRKFPKDRGPLSLEGLSQLMVSVGLATAGIGQDLTGSVYEGPGGTSLSAALVAEGHDAVIGFLRFGADLGESAETAVLDPGKVAEGLAGLAVLWVKVELARHGDPAAQREVGTMLLGLGQQVLSGVRGADRLGVSGKVARRLKWRLMVEIGSFFVGIGEVKAVIEAAGIGDKLAGIVRVIAILARLGDVVDAERQAARLTRLAELISAGRGTFASAAEVADLMAGLPPSDSARLTQLMSRSRVDVQEIATLASLAEHSPELHVEVQSAIAKMELLRDLASRSGGLTDEVIEAFHTLAGDGGLEIEAVRKVIAAIPEGEGARFAAALRRIPAGELAAGSRAAFLELVAAAPARMDAVARLGFGAFSAVYRRAAGRADLVDQYLVALAQVEERLPGADRAVGFRRLLDRLEQDEPVAWLELEDARRASTGERPISDWTRELSGSPRAMAGPGPAGAPGRGRPGRQPDRRSCRGSGDHLRPGGRAGPAPDIPTERP